MDPQGTQITTWPLDSKTFPFDTYIDPDKLKLADLTAGPILPLRSWLAWKQEVIIESTDIPDIDAMASIEEKWILTEMIRDIYNSKEVYYFGIVHNENALDYKYVDTDGYNIAVSPFTLEADSSGGPKQTLHGSFTTLSKMPFNLLIIIIL